MNNSFYFILKALLLLKYLNFQFLNFLAFLVMQGNALIRKLRLISKVMASQLQNTRAAQYLKK